MPLTTTRRATTFLFLLAALAASGCDLLSVDSIGGAYSGTTEVNGIAAVLSFDIPDTEEGAFSFTGTLRVTVNGQTISSPFTGTGTLNYPSISMTIQIDDDGDITTETLTGTVSGSGDTLTLRDSTNVLFVVTR